jgi:ATP-dependent Clp protease ATP-binding subunit ClpA
MMFGLARGDAFCRTGDLLLAILDDRDTKGCRLLNAQGIDTEAMKSRLQRLDQPPFRSDDPSFENLAAKRAIDSAKALAAALGSTLVSTDHLVVALDRDNGVSDRAVAPVAKKALLSAGVDSGQLFRDLAQKQPDLQNDSSVIAILRALTTNLEEDLGVQVPDETLLSAYRIATRYLPNEQFPDNAIDLILSASAMATLSGGTTQTPEVTPRDIAETVQTLTGIAVEELTSQSHLE